MKAIDILRNHIRDLEKMVLVFDEYAMFKSRDESKKAIQELTQVIVELEDLQNRSCENCYESKTCKILHSVYKDRLAELEKVILDYLTKEGFKIDDISCKFEIYLEAQYKLKQIQVNFKKGVGFHSSNIFQTKAETTKEMFDKAFEYFSLSSLS